MSRRVVVIAPKALPYLDPTVRGVFGGAEVQLSLLSKEFARRGFDVTVLVGDYGQRKTTWVNGLTCRRAFRASHPAGLQFLSILGEIILRPHSIVMQRTLTPVSGVLAIATRIVLGKFVYMVAHDRETDGTHRLLASPLGRLGARLCFTMSSLVVTQNDEETRQLKMQYPGATILLNKKGIPVSDVQSEMKSILYSAIWVGRSEHWKDPEVFLRLSQCLPDLRFLMICSRATNNHDLFDKLKVLASELSNVDFIAGTHSETVAFYMQRTKSYVFTSVIEGDWPMVVLEAASYGLPIIAYHKTYDFLIDGYAGGVFVDGDFDTLKHTVRLLDADKSRRHTMGERAQRYVRDYHSIERAVSDLETRLHVRT